jgi:hypothetical protein
MPIIARLEAGASGTRGDTSVIVREDSTPSILDIVTVQSAALWPVNFPLRRSIVPGA